MAFVAFGSQPIDGGANNNSGRCTIQYFLYCLHDIIDTFGFIHTQEVATDYGQNIVYVTVSVVCVWPASAYYPDDLKQVRLPILDRDTCNRPTWYNGEIDETMICAGYEQGGQDACQVGGP
jgi:Trypsin